MAVKRDSFEGSVILLERYPLSKSLAWDEHYCTFGFLYYPECIYLSLFKKFIDFLYKKSPNTLLNLSLDRGMVQNNRIFHEAIQSNKLVIYPCYVDKFSTHDKQVRLTSGETVDVDVCVLGTGYEASYPFLGEDVLGREGLSDMPLFKYTVATKESAWGLSFLYTTPLYGPYTVFIESDARWLAHMIANGRLCSEDQRQSLCKKHEEILFPFKDEIRRNVFPSCHTCAVDMGCDLPIIRMAFFSLSPWQRRVGLAAAFGPSLPQSYRLRGPHACPKLAGEALVKVARSVMGWKFDALALAVDIVHVSAMSGMVVLGKYLYTRLMK